ncbi:MAG: SpoIIE family protein phosphatase [Gemmataceae bacterium]
MLLADEFGNVLFANDGIHALFGHDPVGLVGHSVSLLVPLLARPAGDPAELPFFETAESVLARNSLLEGRRNDGRVLEVSIQIRPVFRDHAALAVLTIESPSSFRSEGDSDIARFFELSADLFCIASFDGYFLRVNPSFSRILGYSNEDLLSHPFLDFVHPADVHATLGAMAKLADAETLIRFRNRYRDALGNYHWFEWSAQPVQEDGTIFATARNITDQVRLEDELQARVKREFAILENTPAVVYVKGCDGKYEYVNQRYCDLFSVSLEEVCGLTDFELFPRDVAEQFWSNDQRVAKLGERLTIQELVPQDDGVHTYVSTKFPLLDAVGTVAAIAGISTDITDQVRARETEVQLRLARSFQKNLYPSQAPAVLGLETAGAAVPVAQVCGDYYDFIRRAPSQLAVAMGDVSGHGIGPALEMVAVRTLMRLLLRDADDLVLAVEELNRKLCEDLPEATFVSMFVAELDGAKRTLRYVGAGHEAMLIRKTGHVERLESTGTLLGIDSTAALKTKVVDSLQAGDVFLLYTDGLTEAMNVRGDQFSFRRLAEVASRFRQQTPEEIIRSIYSAVYVFSSGKTILDDMTLVGEIRAVVIRFRESATDIRLRRRESLARGKRLSPNACRPLTACGLLGRTIEEEPRVCMMLFAWRVVGGFDRIADLASSSAKAVEHMEGAASRSRGAGVGEDTRVPAESPISSPSGVRPHQILASTTCNKAAGK